MKQDIITCSMCCKVSRFYSSCDCFLCTDCYKDSISQVVEKIICISCNHIIDKSLGIDTENIEKRINLEQLTRIKITRLKTLLEFFKVKLLKKKGRNKAISVQIVEDYIKKSNSTQITGKNNFNSNVFVERNKENVFQENIFVNQEKMKKTYNKKMDRITSEKQIFFKENSNSKTRILKTWDNDIYNNHKRSMNFFRNNDPLIFKELDQLNTYKYNV